MIYTNVDSFTSKMSSTKLGMFEEFNISNPISIRCDSPQINKVVEFFSYPTIKNVSFIDNTPDSNCKVSNEGNNNDQNKFVVEIDFRESMLYTTKTESEYVYTHNMSFIKNLSISVPRYINNRYTYELFKSKRFQITPYIENIHVRKIDDMSIHRTMLLLLDIKFFV